MCALFVTCEVLGYHYGEGVGVVRFRVVAAASVNMTLFRDNSPYSVVESDRPLGQYLGDRDSKCL